MAKEDSGANRTQIIVAVITVIGLIGSALIANWAGVFGGRTSSDADSSTVQTPDQRESETAQDAAAQTDAQNDSGDAKDQTPPAPNQVDLSFVSWSFNPKIPVQGQPVQVRIGIKNLGSAHAEAFKVEWWAGVNYPSPAEVWQVQGLAPGQEQTLTFTYPGYPSWYAKIQTKAVIDPDRRLPDINRENNAWVRATSVSKP